MTEKTKQMELLGQCGLSKTEQVITLFLLENRRASAALITKRTGIKRPTVYSALLNLESQGFLSREKVRGVIHFSVVSADSIPYLLRNKAKSKYMAIEKAAKLLEKELPLLQAQVPTNNSSSGIKLIESKETIAAAHESILASGAYRAICSPSLTKVALGEEVAAYLQAQSQRHQYEIREIITHSSNSDGYLENIVNTSHQVLQLGASVQLNINLIITSDAAILLNYSDNKPTAVLFEDHSYCQFLMTIFDMLWELLKAHRETDLKAA